MYLIGGKGALVLKKRESGEDGVNVKTVTTTRETRRKGSKEGPQQIAGNRKSKWKGEPNVSLDSLKSARTPRIAERNEYSPNVKLLKFQAQPP